MMHHEEHEDHEGQGEKNFMPFMVDHSRFRFPNNPSIHPTIYFPGRILTLPPERRSPTRQALNFAQKRAGSAIGAPQCWRGWGSVRMRPTFPASSLAA